MASQGHLPLFTNRGFRPATLIFFACAAAPLGARSCSTAHGDQACLAIVASDPMVSDESLMLQLGMTRKVDLSGSQSNSTAPVVQSWRPTSWRESVTAARKLIERSTDVVSTSAGAVVITVAWVVAMALWLAWQVSVLQRVPETQLQHKGKDLLAEVEQTRKWIEASEEKGRIFASLLIAVAFVAGVVRCCMWMGTSAATVSWLWSIYLLQLRAHPCVTSLVQACLIYAVGDQLAQAAERGLASLSGDRKEGDRVGIPRTARVAAIGTVMNGLLLRRWYAVLEWLMPEVTPATVLAKTCLDSLAWGPISFGGNVGGQRLLMGDTPARALAVVRRTYLPALVKEVQIWPAYNAANFSIIPPELRPLTTSLMGIIWAGLLSFWANQSEPLSPKPQPAGPVSGGEGRAVRHDDG